MAKRLKLNREQYKRVKDVGMKKSAEIMAVVNKLYERERGGAD